MSDDDRKKETARIYDRHLRNPAAKKFYNSAVWKRTRKAVLTEHPTCQRCGEAWSAHVHHVKPLADCTEAEKLDHANLMAVCVPCHNVLEGAAPEHEHVAGMLTVHEDDEFFYDPEAAERPIRFIEKLLTHYEGAFAGQPFILHDLQKRMIRDVYGHKSRDTGYRRFTDWWFEAAIGAGKSPLLAGLGLYGLVGDGEAGAQVYSLASEYGQARVVFDTAKRFIEQCPQLSRRLVVKQFEILDPKTKSVWKIVSGKGPKAGFRPSLVLADEIHDWKTREVYDALHKRMGKRRQALWISATNAAKSHESLCWQLHEQAAAVLTGKSTVKTLYPVIWAAPEGADLYDPAAWRAANPLLDTTTSEAKVRAAIEAGRGYPAEEAENRRLYLGHFTHGASKWINQEHWKACTSKVDAEKLVEQPLYVGLDLSGGDDLCAATYVWCEPDHFTVTGDFWTPKATADQYEAKGQIPYSRWATSKAITLLDEPTISLGVQHRIADHIIDLSKRHKLVAVCYDRAYSGAVIPRLQAADIECRPVGQGWGVSNGCQELERRLKEQSITITDNPVMQFCAENVEAKSDDKGNIWPVKPNAKGSYKGRRSAKIDGISALVTALTEARKHSFPSAATVYVGMTTVEI